MEKFKCCRCKNFKIREDFGGISKRSDYCKPCSYEINKKYSIENRDERNAQNRKCAAKRYAKNRSLLLEYLNEHPCVDCGEKDPIVLEFDHISPLEKRKKIADTLGSWNWNTIMQEIAKCQVRCANCHRRRTATQFGWYKGGDANDTDEGLD